MENLKLTNIKNSISQLKIIYDKHAKLQKETGAQFNIFSILNMERLEVRTHSAFLYELLSPNGSHCQGYVYLKLFIEKVLQIDDFDFENIAVYRERDTREFGRIDLIIENSEKLVIIEMKIDAEDQKEQLKRYSDYGKTIGKKYKIYYLTLFGTDASQYSIGANEEIVDYINISFERDILSWIDACIRSGNTPFLPSIRESLKQYIKVVEKITNQAEGGLVVDIKDFLLKDNNLEIIDEVAKVIPYAKAEVEFDFWYNLHKKVDKSMVELGYKFIEEDENFPFDKKSSINDIADVRKNKAGEYCIDYLVGHYKKFEVRFLIGNVGYDNYIYVTLALVNSEGVYISFKEYDDAFLNTITSLGFDKAGDVKYKYLTSDLNFQDYNIYKLLNKQYMDKSVEAIGSEILEICKTIKNSSELNRLLASEP